MRIVAKYVFLAFLSAGSQALVAADIIFEGILSIREGEHPKLMEDKLKVYLSESKEEEKK